MHTSMPAATSMRRHAPPDRQHDSPAVAGKSTSPGEGLDERTREFYLRSMDVLDRCGVPYCVGGAYALAHYAGIVRHTKDLDFFLRKDDMPRAVEAFDRAGYRTHYTHPHWLAKAYETAEATHGANGAGPGVHQGAFIDLIF